MTSPIDNNRPRPTGATSPSAPAQQPQAKPELTPANSTPPKLGTQPQAVKDGMDFKAASAKLPNSSAAAANKFFASFKPAAMAAGAKFVASLKTGLNSYANAHGPVFNVLKASAKSWHAGAVDTATKNAFNAGASKLGVAGAAAGVAGGLYGIKSGVQTTIEGIKNGDGRQVAGGVLATGKSALGTVKGALNTAAAVESYKAFQGVEKAALAAIGNGTKLEKAIATAAATAVHTGEKITKLNVLGEAAKSKGFLSKMSTMFKQGASSLLGHIPGGTAAKLAGKINANVMKTGAQALVEGGSSVRSALLTASAASDAARVAAKGTGNAAKLAGRFAPGLNIGIAAMDVGIAIKTITDPNASVAAKVTSGITALGSIAAATNIPIVSQVGAAVSLASTAVGAVIENAGAIKSAIASGVKKVFSGW